MYSVVHPCDEVVAICRYDNEGEMIPIDPEGTEMDDLYPFVSHMLEEEELYLMRTATTLTLQVESKDDRACCYSL